MSFFDRFFYEMFDILSPKGIIFLEHTRIVYTEAVAPACENAVRIPYWHSIIYWIILSGGFITIGYFIVKKKSFSITRINF